MKRSFLLITLFAAFAIQAAEAPPFDVSAKKRADGRISVYVRVELNDGPFALTFVTPPPPYTRTISTAVGGTTHHLVVELAASGRSKATLTVLEGRTPIATKAKLFDVQPLSETRGTDTGVIPPKVLKRAEPRYPNDAKTHRVAGVVVIEARIDEHGNVTHTRILKNLPYGVGEAAAEAVRQWKYSPATREGKAVAVTETITLAFQPD